MDKKEMKNEINRAVATQLAQQAVSGGTMPGMQVIRNGSINDAVNFAVEDFYKAALTLKRATNNFTVADATMKPGMHSFITQQFFRMNAAGQLLDALGYQGVTEVLTVLHAQHVNYINATMATWNKIIDDEGEVKALYDQIAAEEKAQQNPPATAH